MKRLICTLFLLSLLSQAHSQWSRTGGPSCGAMLASNGNYLFGATATQLYYSLDSGKYWFYSANYPNYDDYIYVLKFNGNDLYVLTDSRVLKSTDFGLSWNKIGFGSGLMDITFKDDFIFVSDLNGVKRTSNNGQNWMYRNNGLKNPVLYRMYTLGGYIFGSVPSNIYGGSYRTSNNGDLWELKSNGLEYLYPRIYTSLGNTLFVSQISNYGIYKSTDYGENWTSASTGINSKNIEGLYSDGISLYACAEDGLYTSTNAGGKWIEMAFYGCSTNNFAYQNGNMFVNSLNRLYRSSNNGVNWSAVDMSNLTVYTLAINNGKMYASTKYGFYNSTDNGTNWSDFAIDPVDYVSEPYKFVFTDNKCFASNKLLGKVYRSNDEGLNWYTIFSLKNYSFLNDFSTNGNSLYVCDERGYIFRSTDFGLNWDTLKKFNSSISSVISKNNDIYAGGLSRFYYSSNSGTNWDSSGFPTNRTCKRLYFKNDDIVCAMDSGLYKTTNKGLTWNYIGLKEHSVLSLLSNDDYIFAGTKNGLFISSDYGNNWIQKNEGLVNKQINDMIINNGYLYAGTNFTSVYKLPLNSISVNNISTKIPGGYSLSQNYPNPFNPKTKIRFQIKEMSSPYGLGGNRIVALKVYDILGKEVVTLINEKLKPGEYETTFERNNLPSGIYFYSLYADGKLIDTKKMVLLR